MNSTPPLMIIHNPFTKFNRHGFMLLQSPAILGRLAILALSVAVGFVVFREALQGFPTVAFGSLCGP